MRDRRPFVEIARKVRSAGGTIGEVLTQLRRAGAEQIDCVVVIREVESVSLTVAKELVDSSDVWADRRVANAKLRDEAINALDVLAEEESR
jgi:ribosomal protein L7/L12